MFEWYSKAALCLTYLHDVDSLSPDQRRSEWFDRGWTLQELLAPRHIEFFGQNWNYLGNKQDLAGALEHWSGIERKFLTGQADLRAASVAARMSWMAGRTTTLVEDIAYAMLGLLGIFMTPQYGEGVKAFARLQRTLLESSTDESLFAWTIPRHGLMCYRSLGSSIAWAPKEWGLLAPSPDCFAHSGNIVVVPERVVTRPFGGYRMSPRGLVLHSPLKGHTDVMNFLGRPRSQIVFVLNCWTVENGKLLTIHVELHKRGEEYVRVNCDTLLQKAGASVASNRSMGVEIPIPYALTIYQPPFELR